MDRNDFMKITVTDAENGITIKQYLERQGFSARLITRLKAKERGILVNGERKTVRWVLKTGDLLELETEDSQSSKNISLSHVPVNVLYEDDWFIAVEKPANLPIHPSRRHTDDTLASRVMAHFKDRNFIFRVLTRLDIDTSGAVLIAKDSIAACQFSKMLAERTVLKEYLAICQGSFDEKSGTIDYNIRRPHPYKMEREAVEKGPANSENSPEGNQALTQYSVICERNGVSLVRFIPVTGRTHQLRVHAKAIGHPIIGDLLYSAPSQYIGRQALHAERLSFVHPVTSDNVCIVCPPSRDFTLCQEQLFNE